MSSFNIVRKGGASLHLTQRNYRKLLRSSSGVQYTFDVDLRNRFVSQITRAEILGLIAEKAVEDDYLEFKAELLNRKKTPKVLEDDKEDLMADLVAFANAGGGLMLIGIAEDQQGKAESLRPMTGDEAKKLADTIRDLAIAYIKPGNIQLEVVPFQMKDDGSEWIVAIRTGEGIDKPYMSAYRDRTHFAIRVGNRKRSMAHEEILHRFVSGPQDQRMAEIVAEIKSIRSLIGDLGVKLER